MTGYAPAATFFNNHGPEPEGARRPARAASRAPTSRASGRTPRAHRRADARPTPSPRPPPASTRRSPRRTRASRRNRVARRARAAARPASWRWSTTTPSRPLFGLSAGPKSINVLQLNLGRLATTRSGRRRGDGPLAAAARDVAVRPRDPWPAVAASLPQARPARAWSATRSCSWSRSARCSRPLADPGIRRRPPGQRRPGWFTFTVAVWLWLTVLFGNFAEALAEGRGRAQAATLRAMRTRDRRAARGRDARSAASELPRGDVVVVEAGEVIPGDGTVVEGIASVDESAITGESAPVIREAGGDRSAVTGGTRVLSDRIVVEITQEPGQSFLDRMIALVEGAERRKTPNEIALNILLAGLTLVFLVVVVTLRPFARVRATPTSPITDADRAAGRADPDDDRRAAVARSASPAWTGSCAATCSRSPAARSRRPATSTCCCSTRPARSRSATAQAAAFVPMPGVERGRAGRGRAAGLARRRDARGPLDRRAGQAVRHPRARARPHCTRSSSRSPRRRA